MSTYTENNFQSRFDSTMQASDWLSKQLVDLQLQTNISVARQYPFRQVGRRNEAKCRADDHAEAPVEIVFLDRLDRPIEIAA